MSEVLVDQVTGSAYVGTLQSMTIERITVSLDSDLAAHLRRLADRADTSVSAIVAESVQLWIRGRLLDELLDDIERETRTFDEADIEAAAAQLDVPYVARQRPRPST